MDAVSSRCGWANLPEDLLREISGRLHDAVDVVRFHAVSPAWRDMVRLPWQPDQPKCPVLLPWLLARGRLPEHVAFSHLQSVFSKATLYAPITGRRLCDMWMGSTDGAGAWVLTTGGSLVNPLTGATVRQLPRFPDDTIVVNGVAYTDGVVCGDGTIVAYTTFDLLNHTSKIEAAILRPGDAAWTTVESAPMTYAGFKYGCSATYHQGSVVFVDLNHTFAFKVHVDAAGAVDEARTARWPEVDSRDRLVLSTYTLEHRGELMSVCVEIPTSGIGGPIDAGTLSLSLYTLETTAVAGDELTHLWVRAADGGRLLGEHAMFLGFPTSFAVDAARFGTGGEVSGGCAYFVLRTERPKACHVYKYNFHAGVATVMAEMPPGWFYRSKRTLWFVPRVAPTPTHEIRERPLEAPSRNVPAVSMVRLGRPKTFKINLQNLPSLLVAHLVGTGLIENSCLHREFSDHGDVTDVRVHYRDGEIGVVSVVVTMATVEEPADIAAALEQKGYLEIRPLLVVEFAEERPQQGGIPTTAAPTPTIVHTFSPKVFTMHVGNLPWHVDRRRLLRFFSEHGTVSVARVVCDELTGRSRGFGFVTMATWKEPADIIASLNGQIMDGRPMRVKFAN